MADPILEAAVELKKMADELKNPEVDRIMNDIMNTILDAVEKQNKQ